MKRYLFLSCLVLATAALAEEQHDAGAGKAADPKVAGDVARPKQVATTLKPEETRLLSTMFRIPTQTIGIIYGGKNPEMSIPRAVDAALAGDEAPMAKIAADLFGTLNRNQADTAIGVVNQEREAELKKNPRDARFVALLDRLYWAGKILDGDSSDSEGSQKYNSTFEAAFKERNDRTALITEKVKEALAGNNQAKEFLRKQLNRQTIMAFIDAQRKSGNVQLANDLVQALAFGGENGQQKFLDLYNGAETHRLNLGLSKESMEKALTSYSDARGGLHSTTLAGKSFPTPPRTFSVGADGNLNVTEPTGARPGGATVARPDRGGAPKAGGPVARRGNTPPPNRGTPPPQRNANPPPVADAGPKTPDAAPPQQGNSPPPPTGGSGAGAGFANFISGNCVGCHADDPVGQPDGKIKKGSKTFSIPETLTAINRVPSMRNGVSAAVKAQLQAFSR